MEIVANLAITAGAAGFRGITGFGYALIAAIGFSGSLSPHAMVPLILINDLVLTAIILLDRKHGAVDWPVARLLLGAGFVGALAGGYVSGFLDENTTKLLIAAVVAIAAIVAMVHEPPRWLANRTLGVVVGVVVGVLLSTLAVGGPLVAVWLLAGGVKRDKVRGTLAVFFGAVDLFGVVGRASLGQIDADVPRLVAIYLPFTLIGYFVGHWIGPRLGEVAWRRVSAIGLIVIAAVGALQTLWLLFGGNF